MARNPEHQARGQRLVAVAAVGLLASATALAFGRVFVGRGPTLRLLAAALLSLAVAALLERRSLLLATLVSAAMLLVTIGWLVRPETLWYGLPSTETLVSIGRALQKVGEQARVQVAPTRPLAPLMLAAVTAVWTATFSAHALAIRAGSPLLAVLPPVALVGFADTVLEDGARPFYAVTFLGAALAVVFVDGLRRIRQWGPVWAWHGRSRRLASSTARGAQRVAVAAVAVAVLVPGILPGFRSEAIVDFSSSGSAGVDLDPFVSIKAQLDQHDPVDIFRVRAVDATGRPVASYWRKFSLDQFDGSSWRSSDPSGLEGRLLYSPADLEVPAPSDAPVVEQSYEILTDLANNWLPMAYPPQTVQHPGGTLRFDADMGGFIAPGGVGEGDRYEVTSRVISPSPAELDAVTAEAMAAPSTYYRNTFLPGDVPVSVRDLAVAWTKGADTPYRKVLAIQEHFTDSGEFAYSQDIPWAADTNALVDFLTVTKTGFCVQFATGMAVLLRELGIPARIAVGYRQGALNGDTFTVNSHDAHSWTEVYFAGYGWLPFEPTPTLPNPLDEPGSYLSPEAAPGCVEGVPGQRCPGGGRRNAQVTQGSLDRRIGRIDFREGAKGGGGALADIQPVETGYRVPYGWISLALLGLAGLFLLLTPIVKALGRRRMLRRAREPRELVLATFRVFDGEAADLGLGRAPGETLAEYVSRLERKVPFSDGHLERLVGLTTRAAYSDSAIEPVDAREVGKEARTALRDMRRDAGLLRRISGTYRLGL